MEVAAATATSFTTLRARTSPMIPSSSLRNLRSKGRYSSSSSLRASLSNGFLSSCTGGSISSDFCGAKLRTESLNPLNMSSSKPKRGVVTMYKPHVIATATVHLAATFQNAKVGSRRDWWLEFGVTTKLLKGASYLLRATSWELYGSAPMARMNTLVYATLFGDSSSSSDSELAYLKLIQHLALYKGYKDAFAALKIAEEKFLTVSKSKILLLKLQLLHERALHWE